MSAVKAIDKQINSYLGQLNENQKKAVLTVVKTFAERFNDFYEFLNLFIKPQHNFFINDHTTRVEIKNIKNHIKIGSVLYVKKSNSKLYFKTICLNFDITRFDASNPTLNFDTSKETLNSVI